MQSLVPADVTEEQKHVRLRDPQCAPCLGRGHRRTEDIVDRMGGKRYEAPGWIGGGPSRRGRLHDEMVQAPKAYRVNRMSPGRCSCGMTLSQMNRTLVCPLVRAIARDGAETGSEEREPVLEDDQVRRSRRIRRPTAIQLNGLTESMTCGAGAACPSASPVSSCVLPGKRNAGYCRLKVDAPRRRGVLPSAATSSVTVVRDAAAKRVCRAQIRDLHSGCDLPFLSVHAAAFVSQIPIDDDRRSTASKRERG